MLVIDRFEGDYAIVEDGNKHIKLEKNLPMQRKVMYLFLLMESI